MPQLAASVALDERRLLAGGVVDDDGVAGVAGVGLRPAEGAALAEMFRPLGTVPTVGAPGLDAVGEVPGVALVVQGELLDGLLPVCNSSSS